MNYKAIALNTLIEYSEENSEYSVGQLLYSFLREPISGIVKFNELNSITDEDLYTIIEKAKAEETDEPFVKQ
jgi:hypothetical protein